MDTCVADSDLDNGSDNALLKEELRKEKAEGIMPNPILVINELQYRGTLLCHHPVSIGTCDPLQAICAGFQAGTEPEPCSDTYWNGFCYPPLQKDLCGKCNDPSTMAWNRACMGCDGVPNSGVEEDYCGICGGDGTFDQCGMCLSQNSPYRDSSCKGCDGALFSQVLLDACGVCGGDGSLPSSTRCLWRLRW